MRENVTQGACPQAPALKTGALNHQASFLPSFPPQQLAALGEGVTVEVGDSHHLLGLTYSSLTAKLVTFLPPWMRLDAALAPVPHKAQFCSVLSCHPTCPGPPAGRMSTYKKCTT